MCYRHTDSLARNEGNEGKKNKETTRITLRQYTAFCVVPFQYWSMGMGSTPMWKRARSVTMRYGNIFPRILYLTVKLFSTQLKSPTARGYTSAFSNCALISQIAWKCFYVCHTTSSVLHCLFFSCQDAWSSVPTINNNLFIARPTIEKCDSVFLIFLHLPLPLYFLTLNPYQQSCPGSSVGRPLI